MISTVTVLVALVGLGKVIDLIDDKSPTVVVKSKTGYPIIEKVRAHWKGVKGFGTKNEVEIPTLTLPWRSSFGTVS